ncbi:transcription factor SPT8 [Metarhizium album ARSEF 1941]|uniref:Transcription factor SPT8 n=1 Tax=Metarhizium album (strain ARSEF 1941) TaxID=1081103 RepID=A0A0B2WLN8_METAS|nr:transcription factor SPT8 [Metarhizium album ARSEF 1941]KHN94397.1 transcription factor SPT8 [Metarhizium album ARSEF 1941]
MDEEDRFSASSPESDRPNEPDEVIEDAEDGDNDAEQDDDNNDDDDENNDDEIENNDGGDDATQNATASASADGDDDGGNGNTASNVDANADGHVNANGESGVKSSKSATPTPSAARLRLRPSLRQEAITARLYDIVPTMAAPQSTSINAMAITPDLRYWITGGSDGYIRKYDGPGTINGKLALTVAQKHSFVDSVTKAGILMSYWENEEPAAPGRGDHDHNLSPVYSLAVHSRALWLLSGLEFGGINLQSVRHDEGKKIACLQRHTNAVSSLMLAPDEKSVLSGGWDKNIFDWDLNTGQTTRSFDGSGGQISSIELRPASGDPVPVEADEPIQSTTVSTNNGVPLVNGVFKDESGALDAGGADQFAVSARDAAASPVNESLFGGSDAGSLFGETAGEQPFGNDDDSFGANMDMMPSHEGGMDHSADFAMTDLGTAAKEPDTKTEDGPAWQTQTQDSSPSHGVMHVDRDKPSADAPAKTEEPAATQRSQSQPLKTEDDAKDVATLAQDKESLKKSQSPAWTGPPAVYHHQQQQQQQQFDQSQVSATTFLSSAIDGTIRIWDRRAPSAVARIGTRHGVPPWCMSACWSPDGNMIYAGRRNGTVEEFDVRRARSCWEPERALKFPAGSGAVSAVRPMPNGRHLVCASHDILRLYDLHDTRAFKHSTVPFLIIPGPPRAGVISSLYIDPTSRFMLSAAGTRGWDGTSTEVLIGYEINVIND